MKDEIKEILEQLNYAIAHSEEPKKAKRYYDAVIDLQQRIDKAINYLNDCKKTIETNNDNEIEDYLVSASILLEILKGSDE